MPAQAIARRDRAVSGLLSVALALLLAGCTTPPEPAERPAEVGVVDHVVDGDTVDVDGVGRVRVIGIDTPERSRCGYAQSSAAMASLVAGREVRLARGTAEDTDRYGRLLRYVDVDGRDAGLVLIVTGWAVARYDSRDGYPRHPREDLYRSTDAGSPDLGCY